MEDLLYSLDVKKHKKSINTLVKNLDQIGRQSLLKEFETMPKLFTYAKIKINTGTEGYIENNITTQQRSILAKFRTGAYPINIETEQYTRQPLKERTCPNCINAIQDETHLLVECPLYSKTRKQLI